MDGASLDWKRLNVIFGPHRITGRAKGTAVSVVYNAEANVESAGIDGTGYFTMSEDLSARVTVILTLESESNDVLSSFLALDRQTPGGLAHPLVVEDANGRTLYASARAKIVKLPDGSWSDGTDTRAWVFAMTRLDGFVGGMNATPTTQ